MRGGEKTRSQKLLDGFDALLTDLDGVVYKGRSAIPGAVESLNAAAQSVRIGYVTNNASRTDHTVAEHLSSFGLGAVASDVVTSPQLAVQMVAELVAPASLIHVVGGDGLVDECEKAGFSITRSADDMAVALLQGFAPTVGWADLAEAAFALHRGIPWIATNMDWTLPLERGLAPGNGTLVSAVHTAVGRLPTVAGKPEPGIFLAAQERFSSRSPLVIGDRLDTDILGANRAGMASAVVLTGVDGAKQLLAADPTMRPRYILRDLRDLHEPYPEIVFNKDRTKAQSRASTVQLKGDRVEVVKDGEPIDLIRSACALVWETGRSIYGLDMTECLDRLGIPPEHPEG